MSLADAFAPVEQAHKNAVIQATFGHLHPEHMREYPGTLVFSINQYGGDVSVIKSEFKDVDDSPWYYDHMYEFAWKQYDRKDRHPGHVYRFEGTYRVRKNGTPVFKGKVRSVKL